MFRPMYKLQDFYLFLITYLRICVWLNVWYSWIEVTFGNGDDYCSATHLFENFSRNVRFNSWGLDLTLGCQLIGMATGNGTMTFYREWYSLSATWSKLDSLFGPQDWSYYFWKWYSRTFSRFNSWGCWPGFFPFLCGH